MDAFAYTTRYREHSNGSIQTIGKLLRDSGDTRMMVILSAGRSLPGHSSGVLIHGAENWKKGWISDRSFPERSVTPLILYTCGVPISRSMKTDLLKAVLPAIHWQKFLFVRLAAYVKKDRVDIEHAGEFNDLLVEQMKSLGYLQ